MFMERYMEKRHHKVSVIIPAHNAVKTIKRCVDSILAQTYSYFEVIIVDNGSTDRIDDIISTYDDSRVKYYKTDRLGVSNARNMGIKKSSGEYVSFCDSDDEYDPRFLETMVNGSLIDNVNIVKCAVNKTHDKNDIMTESLHELAGRIMDPKKPEDNEILRNLFFRANTNQVQCTTPSLLIKKSVLVKNDVIFDKDVCMMEDVLFYADLINSNERIKFIKEPLYFYYQNPDSATHAKHNYKKIIDGAVLSCSKLHEKLGDDSDIDMKYLKIIFHYMYCEYFANGNIYLPDALSEIAQKARMNKDSYLWLVTAIIIENKQLLLLKPLFHLRNIKSKLKGRKDNKTIKGMAW